MKRIIAVLCLAICLLTAGCKQNSKAPETPDNTEQTQTDNNTQTPPESTGSDTDASTENTDPQQPFNWDTELVFVRQNMLDESKTVAVAYLGHCGSRADAMEYIKNNCKRFNEDYGFLSHVPDERIIGDGGQLFCVLAYDSTSAISVNRLGDDGSVVSAEWTGDGSIPLLIFANNGGFDPDMQVAVYTGDSSELVNLQIDYASGRFMTGDKVLDFSNYHDVAQRAYADASEGAWDDTTKESLVNTSWNCTRYINDEVSKTYSLDFFEDTVKIVWNDGADEQNQEFTANWSLDKKDGVAVLTVDLANLDGVRSYAILTSYDMLSVFADFTGDGEIRSYEALNTLFSKTLG